MTTNQLREVLAATPFRPFCLRLADGATVEVPHPEFMWIHPGGRTAWVAVSEDAAKIIDVMLVTAIETGNGRQRGGKKRKR